MFRHVGSLKYAKRLPKEKDKVWCVEFQVTAYTAVFFNVDIIY